MEGFWFVLTSVFLISGAFLIFTGAVGVLRFPDFYTRMHASSLTDTMGSGLILTGCLLLADHEWLVMAKLVMIFLFLLLTGPTANHALVKAALHSGLKPKLGAEPS
ncbi:MAG TPA: sodium:proton antiporter [Gammaproteobacteria bacterium]|nr:sodium:proton antiporter [Gammaproteobacteria bacterium]